ncbi:MAG: bifunctional diaminohydroxyphosphoribosylaminopyrimidine deaminase/5-amino-6-(5-phosphoribosylamino)uracil reductase RibD [Eubacteriales bacterium]|nr:bifunctional diaminohydroxyphosphoribosylaminopyrimidine deaminase/5-amino-6-(5-phosphoribosylamino)uracil reductase RibD [Eubacteriales bacterium]
MNDLEYMKIAIKLARKGAGYVNPNPMVGAIIVKDNKIIGQGYHEYYGGLHAEQNAIKNCKVSLKGASLYVTLEPCCHYGKTPPCTEVIIKNGISNVIIGTLDPNSIMAGKSVEILRKNGINVKVGILEDECKKLIKIFQKFITTKHPFVLMKYAMTMDGKIATYTNQSKWISGEQAREQVHNLRNSFSAIMVGVNTVIQDNPLLTCRLENGKNPIRIICDTNLRTPLKSQIVKTSKSILTYIATNCDDIARRGPYEKYGCKFIYVEKKNNHIDIKKLMTILGNMGIDSILLEGGSTLNWNALDEQIVDEIHTYIAPKVFGGIASTAISGKGIAFPNDAIKLEPYNISKVGSDYLIESEVIY